MQHLWSRPLVVYQVKVAQKCYHCGIVKVFGSTSKYDCGEFSMREVYEESTDAWESVKFYWDEVKDERNNNS